MSAEQVTTANDIQLPLPVGLEATVLHGELSTFLIYASYYATNDSSLKYVFIECTGMGLLRFGYPNDEGLGEHRLYHKGLASVHGFGEVHNSELLEEYESMRKRSFQRIWRGRDVPEVKYSRSSKRHFIISLKENVFEVLCEDLRLVAVFPDQSSALQEAIRKLHSS
ncbi:MAG: hypothetical protein JWQ71_369 [Pedosphaera sp.]|nr:hypothetical protein [Pedosphaera sp.]